VRHLIPRTCTSIEPGIYVPEFGIRTEVNVYIADREARVTGPVQNEILALLA
jgi:Xaa-Pro dipeptidase